MEHLEPFGCDDVLPGEHAVAILFERRALINAPKIVDDLVGDRACQFDPRRRFADFSHGRYMGCARRIARGRGTFLGTFFRDRRGRGGGRGPRSMFRQLSLGASVSWRWKMVDGAD